MRGGGDDPAVPDPVEGREGARPPEPFVGDQSSLADPPLEDYTSEPIPLADGDAGNDSG